jgi:hypothetical protein
MAKLKTKIPSHPNQFGNHQEKKQKQILVRIWGKGNPETLLVGI